MHFSKLSIIALCFMPKLVLAKEIFETTCDPGTDTLALITTFALGTFFLFTILEFFASLVSDRDKWLRWCFLFLITFFYLNTFCDAGMSMR